MDNYKCHFCGGDLVETGDKCWDNESILVGKCKTCDFVQLLDFSHITIDFYNSEGYWPEDFRETRKKEELWNIKRVKKILEMVPGIKDRIILDYGSGSAGFLIQAQGKLNVIGYDVNPIVSQMHSEAGLKCVSSLDDVKAEKIEAITIFNVLEHVYEPWTVLSDFKEQFINLKNVIIEVPNTGEVLRTILQTDAYARNHHNILHLWYFTMDSIRKVIERSGLKVITETQFQRYTLANTLGWVLNNKGGGQDLWQIFNDAELNRQYERVLVENRIADSCFFITEV